MHILPEHQSKEIKIEIVQKLNIENMITDWISLSSQNGMISEPLWSLAKLQYIYKECLTISNDVKETMLNFLKEILSENISTVYLFAADGWVDGLDFGDEKDRIYENKTIVELSLEELNLIKKVKGIGMSGDTYIFPKDISWLFFSCHEGFQTICGENSFIENLKLSWKDYHKHINKEWGEIFEKN